MNRNLPACLAVAILIAASVVYAAPMPPFAPGQPIPGVDAAEAARITDQATKTAEAMFANAGEKFGYPVGAKAPEHVAQCLIFFGLMSEVEGALKLAKPGSFAANGLNKAKNWAQKGIDDWCKPRGGQMNHGLLMVGESLRLVSEQNRNRTSLALTAQQRDLLLEFAKWAAVGGAALLTVPSLAVP